MSAAPNPPPAPAASQAPPLSPPIGPNPPHRRFGLLLKLFLVPVAVVSLPTLLVTAFFGQGVKPKAAPDAAFAGLRESLDKAARERLPEGGTNFGARFEDLSLFGPPGEADARLEALRGLATRCGGTLTDQGTDTAGRHLLVELPGENLPRFRREAEAASGPVPPASVEPTPSSAGSVGSRVFLRVTLTPPSSPAP